jgi:putative ABC transport system permease protein
VGGQFAVATPLLIVAGLLLGSLHQLSRVDLGFDTRNILTLSISLPTTHYPQAGQVAAFWDDLQRRAEALPGVADVAFTDGRPPNDVNNFNNFDLEDAPTPPGQSQPVTPWVAITPEYFRLLGLRLVEGRTFDDHDRPARNIELVVVDRAWANRFFPNQSAIGKRMKEGGCTTCPWTTVIGVVSEVKYAGLDKPDQGTVYWLMGVRGAVPVEQAVTRFRYLALRTKTDPTAVLPAVRQIVRDLDAGLPLSDIATVEELVARSLQRPRALSLLVAALAVVALVLSIVGIYGVMAYYVQQHAKEIGIRLALGGSPQNVLRLVLVHGLRVVASGVAVGLVSALLLTRLLTSLLFGVGAADAVTFAAAGAVLLTVATTACLVPARRAVGLAPAIVLRDE